MSGRPPVDVISRIAVSAAGQCPRWRAGCGGAACRGDVELGEHLGQVALDRARAEEQPGCDLRVRQAVTGQPGDLCLLRGQLTISHGHRAPAGGLAGGPQLAPGPRGEPLHAHRLKHAMRGAAVTACTSADPAEVWRSAPSSDTPEPLRIALVVPDGHPRGPCRQARRADPGPQQDRLPAARRRRHDGHPGRRPEPFEQPGPGHDSPHARAADPAGDGFQSPRQAP